MAKVVVASRKSKSNGHRDAVSVSEKRVRGADGQVRTLRILDVNSPTFGDDLQYVFGKNVARARRENKRVTGASDIAPKR